MARKTKEEAAATRESLLDAAELCFLKDGVFRTTLDQIAARAGYTKGAVYWHFKNKYEVLEAVMNRLELPIFGELEKLGAYAGEWPLRALRDFYKESLELLARNIHARHAIEITQLRCELVEETKAIFGRMQNTFAALYERQLEAFRRAQRLGHLREPLDAKTCTRIAQFIIEGALREWVLNPTKMQIQRDGLAALDTILASFAIDSAMIEGKKSVATQPARKLRR